MEPETRSTVGKHRQQESHGTLLYMVTAARHICTKVEEFDVTHNRGTAGEDVTVDRNLLN